MHYLSDPEPLARKMPVDKLKPHIDGKMKDMGIAIPNEFTKLKPGGLDEKYESYRQRVGAEAMSKKEIMEAGSMSAQDFAQKGGGARSISYRQVIALALLLGCQPWELLAENDPHRDAMMYPLKIKSLLDNQARERQAAAAKREEMANFPVPLNHIDDQYGPVRLVDALSAPGKLDVRVHPVPPPAKDYDYDPAFDIDQLFAAIINKAEHPDEGRRTQAAKEIHTLVKTIEDFGLYVLVGFYVERYTKSTIPHEDLENGDVHLRKVLVVKVSAQPEDPAYVVDRSQEPQTETIHEIHFDCGCAPEWQEARRWESCH